MHGTAGAGVYSANGGVYSSTSLHPESNASELKELKRVLGKIVKSAEFPLREDCSTAISLLSKTCQVNDSERSEHGHEDLEEKIRTVWSRIDALKARQSTLTYDAIVDDVNQLKNDIKSRQKASLSRVKEIFTSDSELAMTNSRAVILCHLYGINKLIYLQETVQKLEEGTTHNHIQDLLTKLLENPNDLTNINNLYTFCSKRLKQVENRSAHLQQLIPSQTKQILSELRSFLVQVALLTKRKEVIDPEKVTVQDLDKLEAETKQMQGALEAQDGKLKSLRELHRRKRLDILDKLRHAKIPETNVEKINKYITQEIHPRVEDLLYLHQQSPESDLSQIDVNKAALAQFLEVINQWKKGIIDEGNRLSALISQVQNQNDTLNIQSLQQYCLSMARSSQVRQFTLEQLLPSTYIQMMSEFKSFIAQLGAFASKKDQINVQKVSLRSLEELTRDIIRMQDALQAQIQRMGIRREIRDGKCHEIVQSLKRSPIPCSSIFDIRNFIAQDTQVKLQELKFLAAQSLDQCPTELTEYQEKLSQFLSFAKKLMIDIKAILDLIQSNSSSVSEILARLTDLKTLYRVVEANLPNSTLYNSHFDKINPAMPIVVRKLEELDASNVVLGQLFERLSRMESASAQAIDAIYAEAERVKERIYQSYRDINQTNAFVNIEFVQGRLVELMHAISQRSTLEGVGELIIDCERLTALNIAHNKEVNRLKGLAAFMKAFEENYDRLFALYRQKKEAFNEHVVQLVASNGELQNTLVLANRTLRIKISGDFADLQDVLRPYLDILLRVINGIEINNITAKQNFELVDSIMKEFENKLKAGKITTTIINQLMAAIRENADLSIVLQKQLQSLRNL